MKTATYRRTEVALPQIDDAQVVDQVGRGDATTDFVFADQRLRQLDLAGHRLARGRMTGLEIQRADFTDVAFDSMDLERCAVLSSRWTAGSLTRVRLRTCRLVGAVFSSQKWGNVIFDGCTFEYATFDHIRASGPVVFTDCRLREVTLSSCHFPTGMMLNCDVGALTFDGGDYRGFDLRGNDLSAIRGGAGLSGAVINRSQRQDLAEALVAELDLTYTEDL